MECSGVVAGEIERGWRAWFPPLKERGRQAGVRE